MEKYTNKHKKELFEKINILSKTEHEEIYKILKKNEDIDNNISFSKNKNGVFFNLSDINDNIYELLNSFVSYCINNKKNLDDYDKKINECKINNNYANIISTNSNAFSHESIINNKVINEDWNNIIPDPKSIQKISNYVEKMMSDIDKVGKKKVNIKFNNAKKKFSKKIFNDKKFDIEGFKDLDYEPYVI